MRIVYLYLPGRMGRIRGLKAGKIPTEFFWGAPELEAQGHDVEYIDVHDVPAVNKLRIAAELLLKQKYLPAKVYFSSLFGVKKILPSLKGADVLRNQGFRKILYVLKAEIYSKIGVPVALPKLNVSNTKPYKDYYNEDTQELVRRTFQPDISFFEYEHHD